MSIQLPQFCKTCGTVFGEDGCTHDPMVDRTGLIAQYFTITNEEEIPCPAQ